MSSAPNEASPASSDANGSRGGSLAASVVELPRSAFWLVAANLVPLFGVLFLGWDLGIIMALFWAENAVIGVYAILRIAMVAGALAFFLVPFFSLHYGIFTLVHGVFVLVLFVGADEAWATIGTIGWPLLALAASHGASFVANFLRGGERERLRGSVPARLMAAPYRRVIVMHLTIIGGGFLVMFLGAPVAALALLVALKTGIDLRAHAREHRSLAAA